MQWILTTFFARCFIRCSTCQCITSSIKNFHYDCPNPFGTGTVTQSSPCDRVLGCTECQTSDFCRKIGGADQMCSVNGCCVDDPQKGANNCTKECHSHAHCETDDAEAECFEGCCRKKPSRLGAGVTWGPTPTGPSAV